MGASWDLEATPQQSLEQMGPPQPPLASWWVVGVDDKMGVGMVGVTGL